MKPDQAVYDEVDSSRPREIPSSNLGGGIFFSALSERLIFIKKNRNIIIERIKLYCEEIGYQYVGWKEKGYRKPDGRYESALLINCGNGHDDTSMRTFQIKRKLKCKTCLNELRTKISQLSIDELKSHANKLGGICLEDRNRGHSIKLSWECKNGHKWMDNPWQIIGNNKWCDDCDSDD